MGTRKAEGRVWSFSGTCPGDGEERKSGGTKTQDKKKGGGGSEGEKTTTGQRRGRQVRKDLRQTTAGRKDADTERRKGEPPLQTRLGGTGEGAGVEGTGGFGGRRGAERDLVQPDTRNGPLGPAPGSRVGEGARVSVLQCGGAPPLPARRCVRHRLRQGPRARGGRGGGWGRRGRRPAPEPGRQWARPGLRLAPPLAHPFSPAFPASGRAGLLRAAPRASRCPRAPAAHTVLSSIHSVLVKARRALAEPSPRSPSSPAAPPPAPSRCGVDRWRFVRRARRG